MISSSPGPLASALIFVGLGALAASVNPQEVLDGGNWLLQHSDLTGNQLDSAAQAAGFGPVMLALVQVGTDHFPLAFPLIRHDQLAVRRVGRNELRVIDELRAFALAQRATTSATATPADHGYTYRILSGAPAANGERGSTLIASPEHHGATGVMTFVVDAHGVLWQRDLGESTGQLAATIQTFDPVEGWMPIASEN